MMNETITLSKSSLSRLIDSLLYPNPDDPGHPGPWGPYGPHGPVARALHDLSWVLGDPIPWRPHGSIGPVARALHDLSWVLLNPQPLPPRAGPRPEPWWSAFLARTVIDQAVAQYRLAERRTATEPSEGAFEAVRSYIREFVDDYCGTRHPKWPVPWPVPWPPAGEPRPIDPLDLLVAGAQFQQAADAAQSPLQADFSAAADQLFKTGLQRMENRRA
jgi:hypothetical protein